MSQGWVRTLILGEDSSLLMRVKRFLVASGEDQVAAVSGEGAGQGQADAARGAGDEGDLAG